jgi:hypothetical protein
MRRRKLGVLAITRMSMGRRLAPRRPLGRMLTYKDDVDYCVFCGEWCIGRMNENRGGPEHLRWSRSLTVGPMPRSDRVATLEEAKAQFQKSWDAWKAWAKLEEVS